MAYNYVSMLVDDIESIKQLLEENSIKMYEYLDNHKDSTFLLFYKTITHSDLPTYSKATKTNRIDRNLLYYLSEAEMNRINQRYQNDPRVVIKDANAYTQTAHQSNIAISNGIFDFLEIPRPREASNQNYILNDYVKVYVDNSSIEYFNNNYTDKLFKVLSKNIDIDQWNERHPNFDYDKNKDFSEIQISCAVHGIGKATDEDFNNRIRANLFRGDTLILLAEKKKNEKNLFLIFNKNPIFYNIIGINNKSYSDFLDKKNRDLINLTKNIQKTKDFIEKEEEVERSRQSAWRNMLAKEMMSFTNTDTDIFCPVTSLRVNYYELGVLFTASHIKGYKDENTLPEERYDINNGLLLSSNIDKLFDKHYITIDKNKKIICSYLLEKDQMLKQKIGLFNDVFELVLNPKRMYYLDYHKSVFEDKERERKRNGYQVSDSI